MLLTLIAAPPLVAQGNVDRQLRSNQQKLEEIRRERDRLQDDLEKIRTRVNSISGELTNLEAQKRVTGRIVNELDRQIGSMRGQLDTLTVELILTQDALAEKRAVLERRLAEIYKRGSLWTFQALFAAEDFGDLLSRYKYLYLVSRQDRALVADVEELRDRISERREELLNVRRELSRRRDERGLELSEFLRLERRRQTSLQRARASEREAAERLASLTKDEQRITDLINSLERARRAALATAPSRTSGSIKSDDLRSLEWPVSGGEILYPFGMATLPNRTTILRQGVGIKVPVGTPVQAIEAGTVALAGTLGTYGPSVTINHGGGFYTLYLYLSRISVKQNQTVAKSTVIGLSGGANSDEGPHIEFQIRGENAIALDPVNWLKNRR
ncbi:MAG: peptidoglycan DD-metalloendopeptidase family protein [Gemmatimonadetes bacterium]|nr:peptidoglycan DD-metalloendopeptidase family protein [Gemmatimonadota bacterium]